MEYRWASSTTWSASFPIVGIDYSSVGGGDANDDESLNFTVPAGLGQRYVMIRVDFTNVVAESNETNNIYAIPVTVIAAATGNANEEDAQTGEEVSEEESINGSDSIDLNENAEVETAEEAKLFSVYPNPVRNIVNVQFPAPLAERGNYELRSMTGALVAGDYIAQDATTFSIDVSQFDGGIYFLSTIAAGKKNVERIVITH